MNQGFSAAREDASAGTAARFVPAIGDTVEAHFPDHGGWHPAVVRELDDAGGRFLGAWVALTGGGSHWVSPDRIRPSAAAVSAR